MHKSMHIFREKTDNGSKQGTTDEPTLRSLICSEQKPFYCSRNFFILSRTFTSFSLFRDSIFLATPFLRKVNIKAIVGWCHFQIR